MKTAAHMSGKLFSLSLGTLVLALGQQTIAQDIVADELTPPVIASFTPMSGPMGAVVTIIGANFGATPGENIVYFGAVRATVLSSSPTSLTVLVPAGATYAPVTITVGGLTTYSDKSFLVTFPGCDMLSTDSFAPRQNFTVGTQPYTFGFGDVDGDGKVDMAVALHNSSTIAFFRNISTTGAIAFSPAGSVNVGGTGNTILYPIFADLDGDGRLDLIAANWGTFKVTVFRNASSIGTFAFDPRTDLAVGIAPYCVAVGDFDHDGRPDIVSVNSGDATVSVIRNVSVTGSLNAASFSTRQDFATAPGGRYVAAGDIDGDGFLDIITANGADNTISVIRNNASINGISFGTRVDFSTAESPGWLAIGDLDEDGKRDIVVGGDGSTPANTGVFVHRNEASPGFITSGSLAAKSDVLAGVAVRFVELADLNGDSQLDIIATVRGSGKVAVLRNLALTGALGAGSFAAPVQLDLDPAYPFEVRAADLDGDGRPDLLATWDQNTGYAAVYRNSDNCIPPTINCPADMTVSTDAGACEAVVSFTVTATDSSPGVSVVCVPPSGSTFPKGITTVRCTATNAAGNSAACSFNITVRDQESAVIHCPANITIPCSVNPLVPVTFAATATDNCDPSPTIAYSRLPGSSFPVGETAVTCTATDASGNSSQCFFTVTRAALGFTGFLSPIDGEVANGTGGSFDDPVRAFKFGSKIPVTFQAGCSGSLVTTGTHTLQVTKYSNATDSDPAIDATPAGAATTGNQFRLTDAATGKWSFLLDSKPLSVGTWNLAATLSDGSVHEVWISIKQ